MNAGETLFPLSIVGNSQITIVMPVGTTAKTGETCPESGVWQVVGFPTTTAPIAKHNRMPPYDGKAVVWKLIRLA